MDALLSSEWLGSHEPIPIIDQASVALVRERVRELGAELGLSDAVCGSLVNVASELGHNQLAHARHGQVVVRAIVREGTPGIEVIAADTGTGIADPSAALRGMAQAAPPDDPLQKRSLGIGLSAVLELSDETDFDVRVGEGTCVWARKFGAPVPRRRRVGIYGRPCPGELLSGDHAGFVRSDDALLVGVADGLGHGHFARIAADLALGSLRERASVSLESILDSTHVALQESRGAVMATARLHEPRGELEIASVGNIATRIYGPQRAQRIAGPSAVLGTRGALRKPALEMHVLGVRDVLLLFSDGLSSRFDLQEELDLLREEPIVIAHELVRRYARDNDDALVLVVR